MCILLALNSVNSIVEEDPWILEERKRSVYVFSTKDYARLKGLSPERTFRTFEEAAYGLLDKKFRVRMKDRVMVTCNWVAEVRVYGDGDRIGLVFSPTVHDFIFNLQGNFTRLSLPVAVTVDGKYAKRLFMLLEQQRWRGLEGTVEYSMEELHYMFDSKGSTAETKIFFRDVLNPALKALCATGYLQKGAVEKIKAGRQVVRVALVYRLSPLKEHIAQMFPEDWEQLAMMRKTKVV
jgi:plasmid replication initiation protein